MLAELVVALAVAGVLGMVLTASLLSQQQLTRELARRVDRAAALRIVTGALPAELRFLDVDHDIAALGSDSVSLRALRGVGLVCSVTAQGVVVRYRGLREPEPTKDSVIVTLAAGTPRALKSSSATTQGCTRQAGEDLYRWTFQEPLPPSTVLLLYERGTYYLAADLRYRRGAGGRQPLTPPLFDPEITGLQLDVGGFASKPHSPEPAAVLIDVGTVRHPDRPNEPSPVPLLLRVSLLNGRPAESPDELLP